MPDPFKEIQKDIEEKEFRNKINNELLAIRKILAEILGALEDFRFMKICDEATKVSKEENNVNNADSGTKTGIVS